MSDLTAEFQKACEDAKGLPSTTTDQQKLDLYGLYKQATEGDNTKPQPGMFDFKGKAKWQAYEAQKGKSKEICMTEYIKLVESLKA